MTTAATPENMAHLWRRAGFGASPETIETSTAAGIEATVDVLLAGSTATPVNPPPPALTEPTRPDLEDASEEERQAAVRALLREAFEQHQALGLWWVQNMATTAFPLVEKATLIWHDHFATGFAKVKVPISMFDQNVTLRTLGLGEFTVLVKALTRDPAMVFWLDLQTSTADAPNENFARELMELFTLGEGSYSQEDVREVARAFTGARLVRRRRYEFVDALHDGGDKTVLGETGNFDGDDVVDILVGRRDSARWVARRWWENLAHPNPPDDLLDSLADAYEAGGRRIDQLVRTILTHDEFYSEEAKAGLVKTPVEFVAGALRAFGIVIEADPDTARAVAAAFRLMGQQPFDPPSVGGWPQNRYWTNTAMTRARFLVAGSIAKRVPETMLPVPGDKPSIEGLLGRLGLAPVPADLAADLARFAGSPRALVQLALASPAYSLN
ncbi:MAG: DUF1800 domain-containing protein [Acidimicrobiia bacterium]|nr:DUF1800 domain-containing protein [Acidimicrobiia bacterium]